MSRRILVVDDEPSIRQTFEGHLGSMGYEVSVAASAEEALRRLREIEPSVVITDVRMPGLSGLELLPLIRSASPDVAVIVITAHEDMNTAIAAMKNGAYDYLVKPLDLDQIDLLVERCFIDRALQRRVEHLSGEAAEGYALDRLIGRDPAMIAIYKMIGTLASNRTPALIRGETGTGKEVIARAIHYNSDAGAEPFIAVNCTAIPEPLLESELFGHVRGAFTGAVNDRRGHFERAGTGTIFLDEIGDTSPAFQAKLLRVLQEREFLPVGAERLRSTDARVLAATHRDLEAMVRAGSFREDLYFRLRVVEITVPPLRERRSDIPLLARWFATRIGQELHKGPVVIPDAVVDMLVRHDWPGNVRELENALYRALVVARGSVLAPEDLPLGAQADGAAVLADTSDLSLAGAERAHLLRVLRQARGNKRQASRWLRISRARLDRLLDRHEVMVSEYEAGGADMAGGTP